MPPRPDHRAAPGSNLAFWLLAIFLTVLWAFGGASRADVAGQVVVRLCAWLLLIGFVLFGPRIDWARIKVPAILVGLAIGLLVLHLVPLPPSVWMALPGRELMVQSVEVIGQPQPWRPLSISPSATINALGAMIVPVLVLLLAAGLTRDQHWRLISLLLGLVLAGSLLGLLEFSGAEFDYPLINDPPDSVSGNFANRNHFALFVALGCLLAPAWALRGKEVSRYRAIGGLGALPFLLLVILATGSRAGALLGFIGFVIGLILAQKALRQELARLSRKVSYSLVAIFGLVVALTIALAIRYDRAASITRAVALEADQDLRALALPTVLDMVRTYAPVGSGFGTFDPAYRIVEPDQLLQPAYFNRAHNDWLELVLDGGVLAAALLAFGVIWWLHTSWRAWRAEPARDLPRLGSAAILLIMLASIFDYPARTPMIMALLTLSAVWLAGQTGTAERKSSSG